MSVAQFDTLVEIFEHAIKTHGSRQLFGTKRDGTWTWLSYAEFGKQVDGMRGGLAGLGIGKGDAVAIIANNRVEWAVAAYATYGLGGTFVPMYEAQHVKEWEFILSDCEAKLLVVSTKAILEKALPLLDKLPKLEGIVCIESGAASSDSRVHAYDALVAKPPAPLVKVDKADVAGLIYTSGTTGNPKGVILTHHNFASNVSAIHAVFPMSPEDRSLSFLPWAHSFGQTLELHGLFSMGASVAICEGVDKILDNLLEVQPTLLFSVPRIFNRLYAAVQKQLAGKPAPIQSLVVTALGAATKKRDGKPVGLLENAALTLANKLVFSKVRARFGGRLRYAFSGGAAISKEVAEFIDGIGITVFEGYGLTETSPIATANYPNNRKIGSVGKPIPHVRIWIDTAATDGRADSALKEGEIVIYGPNVMRGYHKRPEENAAVFTSDGGFWSGDMGYLDAEGYLVITGRIKELYKLENGKYVAPAPLEEQFKLCPFIANLMVYGDNKPHNVALIVAAELPLREWAAANELSGKSLDELVKEPAVRELYAKELEHYGEAFKGFESVKDFALITTDFTMDNGMLTPKMSLKRRAVIETYGDLLASLYKA
jgi:long-chain acyl-CoA synthetase